jgi:uncharacterized protein YjiS (DUF1127 family)
MSVINLFVAARDALAERRRRQRAYAELAALDDRSLADIGIHRSQIPAIVEGADCSARRAKETARREPVRAGGHFWHLPVRRAR